MEHRWTSTHLVSSFLKLNNKLVHSTTNNNSQPVFLPGSNPDKMDKIPSQLKHKQCRAKSKELPLRGISRSGLSHSLTGLAAFGAVEPSQCPE